MDSPLQNVQDTIAKNWLEESEYSGVGVSQRYQCQNMIPMFVKESYALYGRSYMQVFKKRPGFTWLLDCQPTIPSTATFVDAISMSALYNIVVAAFVNGTTAYIVQINVTTNAVTVIGTFTVSGSGDFIWLSEISQASGGNLYPGLAVNYMNGAFTASASYYAVATTGAFAATTLTAITDTNFPNKQTPALITIGKFIYKSGINYIATLDGRIYNSTSFPQNDISTWSTSLGVGSINVNQYPDQCLGLERYKQHIVAFGSNSIEFFEDAGVTNSPTPLVRLDQVFIKFGTVSPKTFINIDDIIYWIGYSADNAIGLWKLDGYQPSKISNMGIDQFLLNSFSQITNTGFSCGVMRGKKNLFITPVNGSNSLLNGAGGALISIAQNNNWQGYPGFNPFYTTLALNLEDNLWWSLNGNFLTGQTSFFILPVFNVAQTGGAGGELINQLVFQQPTTGPSTIVSTVDILDDAASGFWYDTINSSQTVQYYPTWITTNPVRFGNNKNKRIDQMVINRESYAINSTVPAAVKTQSFGGILFAMRQPMNLDGFTLTTNSPVVTPPTGLSYTVPFQTAVIPFQLPPTDAGFARTSFNRLGTGRAWSFTYIEYSPADFVTSGYELMAQQYQH